MWKVIVFLLGGKTTSKVVVLLKNIHIIGICDIGWCTDGFVTLFVEFQVILRFAFSNQFLVPFPLLPFQVCTPLGWTLCCLLWQIISQSIKHSIQHWNKITLKFLTVILGSFSPCKCVFSSKTIFTSHESSCKVGLLDVMAVLLRSAFRRRRLDGNFFQTLTIDQVLL